MFALYITQRILIHVAKTANNCRVLRVHNEGIVYSSTLGSKCKKIIAFIVRYRSDPELQLLLSFITKVCELTSCQFSTGFTKERASIKIAQPVQPFQILP